MRVADAVRHGDRASPTLHRLLETIDASDLIVIIDTGSCDSHAVSCLVFVRSAGHVRYVRASVSLRQIDDRLIVQTAHELQHAAEIAAATYVRDEAALLRFYAARSEGCGNDSSCFETEDAINVQRTVARELAGAP